MATFSPVSLFMERLVTTLLECETRQRRFVIDAPLHANLVQWLVMVSDLGELKVSHQGSGRIVVRG